MPGTTYVINTGPGGTWDVDSPEGVSIAFTQDPSTGYTNGATIFIDYTYQQYIDPKTAIHFTGPVADPNGKPPEPGKSFPGLVLQTTLALRNDLGVPITGMSLGLKNDSPVTGTDNNSPHPDDYAHFHQLISTSVSDRLTGNVDSSIKLLTANFHEGKFGPPASDNPAPAIMDTFGSIAPDAIWQVFGGNPNGTFTLHSEDTPGPNGGNFTLSWFALDTPNGDPVKPDANQVRVFGATIPTQVANNQADGKDYVMAGPNNAPVELLPSLEFVENSTNRPNTIKVAGNMATEPTVYGDLKLDRSSTVEVKNGLTVDRGVLTIREDPTAQINLTGDSLIKNLSSVAITSQDNRGHVVLDGKLTLDPAGGNVIDIGGHLEGKGMVFIAGGNDQAYVNDVDGVSFNVNGTLNVLHPTTFHGLISAGSDVLGKTGEIRLFDTDDVSHAVFDRSQSVLRLLNNKGVDRGDIRLHGDTDGLSLNRGASNEYLSLTDTGGKGNVLIDFH